MSQARNLSALSENVLESASTSELQNSNKFASDFRVDKFLGKGFKYTIELV